MNIKEITSEKIWLGFFNTCIDATFLQSWEWGEFQKKQGHEILRLGIFDVTNKNLISIAQVIKIRSKRGSMLFIPHGPLFIIPAQARIQTKIIKSILTFLKSIAKKEHFSFIRIAPIWKDLPEGKTLFKDLGFKTAPIYMHAERTWQLDITKTEEELLKEMRKTTRYSIKKAEKEGVVIETYTALNNQQSIQYALNEFWNIYQQTADRENFVPFSRKFIENEFEAFNKTGNTLILLGKESNAQRKPGVENQGLPTRAEIQQGKPIDRALLGNDLRQNLVSEKKTTAAALIIFTKHCGFYHQGATTHSKIPVSYLLQWKAIQEAKKRGCRLYNFWGTLQPGRTPKNWYGLTLFKQGFGGFQTDYIPTQDYIINPFSYSLNFLYEQYLKWKRGV